MRVWRGVAILAILVAVLSQFWIHCILPLNQVTMVQGIVMQQNKGQYDVMNAQIQGLQRGRGGPMMQGGQ